MGDPRSPSSRAAGQPPYLETLDAHTITLVQTSWARIVPLADAAAAMFYTRLFALDASLKALFKPDLREQKKKLMQMLTTSVDGLRNLPRLVPVLEQLGARHAGYMVQDHHYELVGQALLWTLSEGLGDDFTPEIEAAWRRVYKALADVMRRAAASQGAPEAGDDTMQSQSLPGMLPQASALRLRPGSIEAAWPSLEAQLGPSHDAADTRPPDTRPPELRPPDARTIELVQGSWAHVIPLSDVAATLFYDRLFALEPSIRALFKPDMREQKKKLMQTLSVSVDGLRNPDVLVPVLQNLGARHAAYMVQDQHYDLVGEALLWTLREGLGDAFTPAVEAAWRRTYGFVAATMKQAAAPRAATTAGEKPAVERSMPGAAPARPLPPARPAPPAPASEPAASVSAAPATATTTAGPAGVVIPVSRQDGAIDLRLTLASAPSAAAPEPTRSGPDATASAVLLAVTCGTLVVLAATAVLFGLHTFGVVVVTPVEATYAAPLALMGMAVAVFFLGYWWGRRSARKT